MTELSICGKTLFVLATALEGNKFIINLFLRKVDAFETVYVTRNVIPKTHIEF